MYEEPQKKSYKLVWIAGSSVVVLLIVIGVVYALVSSNTSNDKKTSTAASATATTTTIASKEDVQKKLDKLSADLKQAATDQAAAKAAVADNKNQIKLGK